MAPNRARGQGDVQGVNGRRRRRKREGKSKCYTKAAAIIQSTRDEFVGILSATAQGGGGRGGMRWRRNVLRRREKGLDVLFF